MELRNGAAVRQPDHHKSTENTMRGVTTVKIDISQKRGFTPPSVFHTAGGDSVSGPWPRGRAPNGRGQPEGGRAGLDSGLSRVRLESGPGGGGQSRARQPSNPPWVRHSSLEGSALGI